MPQFGSRGSDSPWVILHSKVGDVTTQEVLARDDVAMYVGTSCLSTGVHTAGIDIVISLQPQTNIHDLVQICGRSGRINVDGSTNRSVCYLLWNNTDISVKTPGTLLILS